MKMLLLQSVDLDDNVDGVGGGEKERVERVMMKMETSIMAVLPVQVVVVMAASVVEQQILKHHDDELQ